MRTPLAIIAVTAFMLAISAPRAFSQVELFGGYSYLQLHVPGFSTNINGWEASLSTHLIGSLGLEANYSDHYAPGNDTPRFTQLYGPRFQLFSFPRIEPFVHALFGTAHGVQHFNLPPPCVVAEPCPQGTISETGFAMALGGGLNVKATHHIWIRVIQADYFRTRINNIPQNDARISAGLILRFGRW